MNLENTNKLELIKMSLARNVVGLSRNCRPEFFWGAGLGNINLHFLVINLARTEKTRKSWYLTPGIADSDTIFLPESWLGPVRHNDLIFYASIRPDSPYDQV